MRHPELAASDRVLVLAPHPDDETLACGGLIQAALAVGAAVRVLFATDGDDNPWPQRWVERRLRIGAADRARWGARRRAEAVAALGVLGVRDPAAMHFFGWPDQGVTDALMNGDAAVAALAAEIRAFAPTYVAAPTLGDRHPDHSALRVMAELALREQTAPCALLGYIVHGRGAAAQGAESPADAARRLQKQHAMQAHSSQLALSARRLLAIAAAPEHFEPATTPEMPAPAQTLTLALHTRWPLRTAYELLLVIADATHTWRLRAPLPRSLVENAPHTLACTDGSSLRVQRQGAALRIQLPAAAGYPLTVFAKLHRRPPRLIVFDREPWQAGADLLPASAPAVVARPVV